MKKIRIAGISPESIVDGPGIRLVVFSQGCPHKCLGCHNPESHDPKAGTIIGIEEILEEVRSNPLLDGITLSGGEPFLQAEALVDLAKEVKKMGLDIITYTGYSFEELVREQDKRKGWRELLSLTDLIVDGRFILDQRNLLLTFRGSENQRIIDVVKSLKEGRVIERDFQLDGVDKGA